MAERSLFYLLLKSGTRGNCGVWALRLFIVYDFLVFVNRLFLIFRNGLLAFFRFSADKVQAAQRVQAFRLLRV